MYYFLKRLRSMAQPHPRCPLLWVALPLSLLLLLPPPLLLPQLQPLLLIRPCTLRALRMSQEDSQRVLQANNKNNSAVDRNLLMGSAQSPLPGELATQSTFNPERPYLITVPSPTNLSILTLLLTKLLTKLEVRLELAHHPLPQELEDWVPLPYRRSVPT